MEDTKTSLLKKSKYSFFNVLSYAFSRAEARMLLKSLNKRGNELSTDEYLNIFNSNIYPIDIRYPN